MSFIELIRRLVSSRKALLAILILCIVLLIVFLLYSLGANNIHAAEISAAALAFCVVVFFCIPMFYTIRDGNNEEVDMEYDTPYLQPFDSI